MKPIVTATLLTALSLTIAACSRNHREGPIDPDWIEEPGLRPEDPEKFDFTPELSNDALRFTSNDLSLRYDDGGIIFSRSTSGNVTVEIVELATGHSVSFSSESLWDEGPLKAPSLKINGSEIKITEASIEHINEKSAWIYIHAPKNHIVLVIDR